jgi:hypothetical protein
MVVIRMIISRNVKFVGHVARMEEMRNAYEMALGSTMSLTQWISGALSLGVKRSSYEADHSPSSSKR